MASTDGTRSDEPTERRPRRARTAAEQRQQATTSDDPEVLAAEIEKTREELAETLDAIADKVSPKRVAGRTKKKVADAVKDGADSAAATVKAGASTVKDAVKDKTGGTEPEAPPVEPLAAGVPEPATAGSVALGATADPQPAPTSGYATPYDPAPASPRLGPPALAGAAAALVVALLVLRRRRSRRSRWS